jgi:HEAT repeat protein
MNIEKLRSSGDVEGVVRSLGHQNEHVRAEALSALTYFSVCEPGGPQRIFATLTALQGSAKDQVTRGLKTTLKRLSPESLSTEKTAVAEALIELGAIDAVLDYYEAHASGERVGLFVKGILNLLTVYAMWRRDAFLLKKLLQSGPFDGWEGIPIRMGQHDFAISLPASRLALPLLTGETDVLAEIGSEEDLIDLAQQARSHVVRNQARLTLGSVGTAKCLSTLIQAAETDQHGGEYGLERMIPRLCADDLANLARHSKASIRNPALIELCKRTDASSFEIILSAASSESETVCIAAIEALGRIRRKEAVATLSVLLEHPSIPVWRAAAEALGAIGDESGLSSLLSISLEKLVDDVVLKAIAEGGAVPRLLEVVKHQLDQIPPDEILKLLAVLRQSLAGSDLAELQDTLALPYAEDLDSHTWAKRKAAIRALGQIGGSVAIQALGAREGLENDYELSRLIEDALTEARRSSR